MRVRHKELGGPRVRLPQVGSSNRIKALQKGQLGTTEVQSSWQARATTVKKAEVGSGVGRTTPTIQKLTQRPNNMA